MSLESRRIKGIRLAKEDIKPGYIDDAVQPTRIYDFVQMEIWMRQQIRRKILIYINRTDDGVLYNFFIEVYK